MPLAPPPLEKGRSVGATGALAKVAATGWGSFRTVHRSPPASLRSATSPFQGEVGQAAHELPHSLRSERYAWGALPLVNLRSFRLGSAVLNRRC